jgi:hypothetical protein
VAPFFVGKPRRYDSPLSPRHPRRRGVPTTKGSALACHDGLEVSGNRVLARMKGGMSYEPPMIGREVRALCVSKTFKGPKQFTPWLLL